MIPVYFHGLPGSPRELDLLPGGKIYCPKRPEDADFASLAADIAHQTQGARLHLIGFSLGAMAALRAAPSLNVAHIDLIAPAAPLDLGNFLPDMAGRMVFRAARFPLALRLLVAAQARMLRRNPERFIATLFHHAPEADHALLQDPAIRATLLQTYRDSLLTPTSYQAEILTYIRPWADALPEVTCPIRIWQGQADTWVPPAMTEALVAALPHAAYIELPGLGHYSALMAALPRILARDEVPSA